MLKKTSFFSEWFFSEFKRFSEAGSAPIRSAVTFYFDIDVRIFFSTSSKKLSIDKKKVEKSRKFPKKLKFSKIEKFAKKIFVSVEKQKS